MTDFQEGCGCIWAAICGIMLIGGLITALTNGSSKSSSPTPSTNYTSPAPTYTSPNINNNEYIPPSIQAQTGRTSSFTPDDAYDEGYYEGYQQGEDDGRQGNNQGYSYDDSNDYYNHYDTKYCDGYQAGYDDGYYSGRSQYKEPDEDEDY